MSRTNPNSAQARITQKPSMTVVIVAGVLGALAAGAYILQVRAAVNASKVETFTVYTTKHAFEPGETVKSIEKDLVARQYPEDLRESMSDAITSDQLGRYLGTSVLHQPIATNGLLTHSAYTPTESSAINLIREGRRMMALSVDRDAVPPILRPGNTVDVSLVVASGGQKMQSMLVIERVKVLAVGTQTAASRDSRTRSFSTVSIEVTPEEFGYITTIDAMRGKTPFTLAVRNATDSTRQISGGGVNPELLDALGIEHDLE